LAVYSVQNVVRPSTRRSAISDLAVRVTSHWNVQDLKPERRGWDDEVLKKSVEQTRANARKYGQVKRVDRVEIMDDQLDRGSNGEHLSEGTKRKGLCVARIEAEYETGPATFIVAMRQVPEGFEVVSVTRNLLDASPSPLAGPIRGPRDLDGLRAAGAAASARLASVEVRVAPAVHPL
jgi:hypothetical protein